MESAFSSCLPFCNTFVMSFIDGLPKFLYTFLFVVLDCIVSLKRNKGISIFPSTKNMMENLVIVWKTIMLIS